MAEPHDYHLYHGIHFNRESLGFIKHAAEYYENMLNRDIEAINKDPHLLEILGDGIIQTFPVFQYREDARRLSQLMGKEIAENTDRPFSIELNFTHKTIKYIKAVELLYLKHLRYRRDQLGLNASISAEIISTVDQRLSALEENTTRGVFRDATPAQLAYDEPPDDQPTQQPQVYAPEKPIENRPVLLESIQILDPTLRQRCLDLFEQFTLDGQHDRYDTVINEATRILEDRIRTLTGADPAIVGQALTQFAFGPPRHTLSISDLPAEQEAAYLLFRGVFGFIRNSVHHRIVESLSPERTLQIVGLIDYLISIAEGARKNTPPIAE